MLICDPTYVVKAGLNTKVKSVAKIVRCICIMQNSIPNTNNVPSA